MSLDKLAGVWRLQSFEFRGADGNLFLPFGERPRGTLVVTDGGHAVLSFCASSRRNFDVDDVFAAAVDGFLSFAGPCQVSKDRIAVSVEYASFPNWVGSTQERLYRVEGDRLTLATPGARLFGGAERTGRAELVRAE